jgi:hypothetical protein
MIFAGAILMLGTIATSATAAPTVYTDVAAFRAAAPSLTSVAFELPSSASPSNSAGTCSICFSSLSYGDLLITGTSDIYLDDSSIGKHGGVQNITGNYNTMTYQRTAVPQSFTAFGIQIYNPVSNFNQTAQDILKIGLNNQSIDFSIYVYIGDPNPNRDFFLGFVDTDGFPSLSIFMPDYVAFRGLQFSTEPVAGVGGVPEPASWAMLIAGFGLTGAAMRRRRLRPVSVAA